MSDNVCLICLHKHSQERIECGSCKKIYCVECINNLREHEKRKNNIDYVGNLKINCPWCGKYLYVHTPTSSITYYLCNTGFSMWEEKWSKNNT